MNVECVICYDEFGDTTVVTTKCSHKFHGECLGMWLRENNVCPYCRAENPVQAIVPVARTLPPPPPPLPHIAQETITIPLQFWFNTDPGLALPIVALPYAEDQQIVVRATNHNVIRITGGALGLPML